jgi:hypothetical protein
MVVERDAECEKGFPLARECVLLGEGAVMVWGCPQMEEAGILSLGLSSFDFLLDMLNPPRPIRNASGEN